jgi:DNA polymerase III epsilon subunit-like protein
VAEWRCYPAILQLSWTTYLVDTGSSQLGQPETRRDIGLALHPSIPWNAESAAIHGLSEAEGRRGTPAAEALTELAGVLAASQVVIAHNLAFDKAVIRAAGHAEADRGGPAALRTLWPARGLTEICTMRHTRDIVRIPSPYYGPESGRFKAPKLNEVYTWLYGHPYDISGAVLHTAQSDTHCLAQVVSGLMRRGHLQLTGAALVPP